jgi:hypothetical protein
MATSLSIATPDQIQLNDDEQREKILPTYQIKLNGVCLCQRIQIDLIKFKQIIWLKQSDRRHLSFLDLYT